ncbi:hypothetical protein [Candidatus Vidania fulgoroideorum]
MKIKKEYIFNFLNLLNNINSRKIKYNLSLNFFNKKIIFYFKNEENKAILIINKKNFYNESFFLNFEKLKNLLKSLKNNDYINLKINKEKLFIKSNNFLFITKIKKKKNSFNFLKKFVKLKKFFKLNGNKFLTALNYNISTLKVLNNDTTGLNILIKKNKIIFFSTDGCRMSYFFFYNSNKKKKKINISKNVVLFVIKYIKQNNSKNIYINFKKGKFYFCSNNFFFISKECNYTKFNYKIINNTKDFYKVKINHELFYNAIKRANSISSEKINWIDLKFKKKKIYIIFNSFNEKLKEIIINKKNNMKKKIRLNIKFLMDFLKHKNSKFFYIYIKNKYKKIIMKYKKNNFKYLVMPIYY